MIRNLGDKKPLIDPTAFISEAAYIVGDVVIGKHSSIWPGTVIRADNGKIVIGDSTNIQDNSVVHGDADVFIGDGVTIGHRVMCHAAEVGDGSLIGNGAVVNDGAKIGSRSIINLLIIFLNMGMLMLVLMTILKNIRTEDIIKKN